MQTLDDDRFMTIQRRMASESPDQFFSQPVLVAAEATLLLGRGSNSKLVGCLGDAGSRKVLARPGETNSSI